MKTYFLLLILSQTVAASQPSFDAAQRPTGPLTNYPYSDLGSTAALIFIVVVSGAFLAGFSAIVIRRCYCGGTVDGAIPLYASASAAASRPRWLSPSGLDPAVVNSFPILKYSEIKHLKIGKGELSCAVCVSEFEDNETLRLLPKCDHVFHPECIDLWLASHSTCPICRANLSKAIESTAECCDSRPEVSEAPIPNQISITVDEIETAPRERVRVFPRPHSTGHSLVRLGEDWDWESHTLRLPEEARRPVDRLDRGGTSDKWFCVTPPFFTRTGSLRSAKVGVVDGDVIAVGTYLQLTSNLDA